MGPCFGAYVVAARDLAVFSLGRLPDDARGRRIADDLAARLHAFLAGRRMTYGEAGQGLGEHPNRLRCAAPTGTVLIHWDGRTTADERRAQADLAIQPWRRLSRSKRDAVDAEAESLPIPGTETRIVVRWDD